MLWSREGNSTQMSSGWQLPSLNDNVIKEPTAFMAGCLTGQSAKETADRDLRKLKAAYIQNAIWLCLFKQTTPSHV